MLPDDILCVRSERGWAGAGCRLVQELRVHLVVMSAQVLSEQVTQDLACLITNTPSPPPCPHASPLSAFHSQPPGPELVFVSTRSLPLLRFVLLLLLLHHPSLSKFLYFSALVSHYEVSFLVSLLRGLVLFCNFPSPTSIFYASLLFLVSHCKPSLNKCILDILSCASPSSSCSLLLFSFSSFHFLNYFTLVSHYKSSLNKCILVILSCLSPSCSCSLFLLSSSSFLFIYFFTLVSYYKPCSSNNCILAVISIFLSLSFCYSPSSIPTSLFIFFFILLYIIQLA